MDLRFEELLAKAIRNKVTDIYFQLYETGMKVFMRGIKGLINITGNKIDIKLFNHLQYKAHLDLSSQVPQSGSFTYFFKGNYYDFRLATICYKGYKDGVLRILNCQKGLKLNEITFDVAIQNKLMELIQLRSGLILFSGLTGSGKTTTLYSLLRLLPNKMIYSLEDPIEVQQDNIIQLEINEKAGFSYDEGIKQILRHHPDVLMIGEIRDSKTALMTIRAALTGTLVLSSIHSKSCYSVIRRLLELQVNQSDLIDVTIAIFYQELWKCYDKNQYTCIFDYIGNDEIQDYLVNGIGTSQMANKIHQAIINQLIEGTEYDS